MAIAADAESGRAFIVANPVDDDGSLTLVECGTDETYHVVDYADERLRDRVAERCAGSTLRLDLAPADPYGLDWKVTRVRPGAPVVPGADV